MEIKKNEKKSAETIAEVTFQIKLKAIRGCEGETILSWSCTSALTPDEAMAHSMEQRIDELNKAFGLYVPMGERRKEALVSMIRGIFLKNKGCEFYWPRQCGGTTCDYGKTTTIVLFLYMWIKCGIISRNIRVQTCHKRISSLIMSNLYDIISSDPEIVRRLLIKSAQDICFVSGSNDAKLTKKQLPAQELCGRIHIGPPMTDNKCMDYDIVIYEETTATQPGELTLKTHPLRFFFYSTRERGPIISTLVNAV